MKDLFYKITVNPKWSCSPPTILSAYLIYFINNGEYCYTPVVVGV